MAAALPEDLIEEVLLRFPPDDPTSLVRAALVCKLWRRLVCGAVFSRRFRAFHGGTPPLLGLVCQHDRAASSPVHFFVPLSSFRPRDHSTAATGRRNMEPLHSSHGHVLLHSAYWTSGKMVQDLFVWDPVTDKLLKLPIWPLDSHSTSTECNAIVLCAGAAAAAGDGCDNLDCHDDGQYCVLESV